MSSWLHGDKMQFDKHPEGNTISQNEIRVATLFPNEASALRRVTAVLMEISEDWETNRTYLTMETNKPPQPHADKLQKTCCFIHSPAPEIVMTR